MPVRRGKILTVHKVRSQLRDVAAELAARGHLNARGQPFSGATISLLLLFARPSSTVKQGLASFYERRDRRSVQRRGRSQRRGLRKLELGSALQRLISAP